MRVRHYITGTVLLLAAAGAHAATAVATVTPSKGRSPLLVMCDGSASTGTGGITTYAWDFGDGGTDTGALVFHKYTNPGAYILTLTVTDGVGATSTVYEIIDVEGNLMITNFTPGDNQNDTGSKVFDTTLLYAADPDPDRFLAIC